MSFDVSLLLPLPITSHTTHISLHLLSDNILPTHERWCPRCPLSIDVCACVRSLLSFSTLWIKNHWISQKIPCSRGCIGKSLLNEWMNEWMNESLVAKARNNLSDWYEISHCTPYRLWSRLFLGCFKFLLECLRPLYSLSDNILLRWKYLGWKQDFAWTVECLP